MGSVFGPMQKGLGTFDLQMGHNAGIVGKGLILSPSENLNLKGRVFKRYSMGHNMYLIRNKASLVYYKKKFFFFF